MSTKTKRLRSALLSSVVAIVLCFSMLLGTTYAWFTDSVTSSNNIIASGNLDIVLEWSTDATNWTEVDENTNIFKDDAKWEPGYTETVYLKISNAGSLALKYNLGINIVSESTGTNINDETFKLSNYIKFAAIEGQETAFVTREEAIAATSENDQVLSAGYTASGKMLAGDAAIYMALVVYMPETVGNEANFKTGTTAPEIKLGLNLFATQLANEIDSFGPDYDDNAAFSTWDGTVPAEMPDSLVVDPATRTITINDAAAFAYLNSLDDAWVGLYTNGQGTEYSNYMPQNGGQGTDYYYHWGWSVKLACDIDLANIDWTPIDLSFFSNFDGQGHTVKNINVTTATGNAGLFADVQSGISNLTVENVNIDTATVETVGAVAGVSHGTISNVTVKNAFVTGNKYVGGIIGYGYANIVNSAVYDSVIIIPATGNKEAGGLAGYLCDKTEVNGNTVKDTIVSAPTVASALVSQPNGNFVISFNTVENVTVITADDTADIFVSNNVGGNSIVVDNTEINCTVITGKVAVFSEEALNTALTNGGEVCMAADITIDTPTKSNGYALTGISMTNGGVLDGNGNTLSVPGANTTWASAVSTNGGTIKNLTIDAGFRGIFVTSGGSKVYLDNVVIDGPVYTISCDSASGHGLEATNSTFNGWTSYAATIGSVKFTDCSFGEGAGYAFCRPYAPTEFVGCDFEAGYEIDARAAITFEDCTIGGVAITSENLATIVTYNTANASVK